MWADRAPIVWTSREHDMDPARDPLLIIGQQVGLLTVVVVLIAGVRRADVSPLRSHQQIFSGLVFGIGAMLAMQTREKLLHGMIFDVPSVMIAVSGLACGPWSALITGLLAASYRTWLGGSGLASALYSISAAGIAGAGLYMYLAQRRRSFDYQHLLALIGLTIAITYSSILLLPNDMRAAAFQDSWLRLALRNFLGISLLGALLIEERRRREFAKALADAAEYARSQAEEIRRTGEELRQAQKMQTLGQLTGGIAHDFNNLLVVIAGNAEVLADEVADPSHRRLAGQVLSAAERAADLTQKLLSFGRKQTLQGQPLDLSVVVENLEPLLRRTLGEHVEIRFHTDGQSFAWADRSLLESAVLNLAINARDAMPAGGLLLISTGNRVASREDDDLKPGTPVVFVAVTDEGCGVAPELLGRVFEPFFTTKGVGQGSGLGLSMVYGFTKQSGGYTQIESVVGQGTTVTITLPAFQQVTALCSHAGTDQYDLPKRWRPPLDTPVSGLHVR